LDPPLDPPLESACHKIQHLFSDRTESNTKIVHNIRMHNEILAIIYSQSSNSIIYDSSSSYSSYSLSVMQRPLPSNELNSLCNQIVAGTHNLMVIMAEEGNHGMS